MRNAEGRQQSPVSQEWPEWMRQRYLRGATFSQDEGFAEVVRLLRIKMRSVGVKVSKNTQTGVLEFQNEYACVWNKKQAELIRLYILWRMMVEDIQLSRSLERRLDQRREYARVTKEMVEHIKGSSDGTEAKIRA